MSTDKHAQLVVYKDRKAGLIFFGIVHILAGFLLLICFAFALAGLAIAAAAPHADVNTAIVAKTMPLILVVGLAMVVWCFWLGIGSILARRWARALILLASWFWFVAGIIALVNMCFIIPVVCASPGHTSPAGSSISLLMNVVTIGIIVVVYIIIPGCLILFYGSPHVKATCEAYDPVERWTDRCPLPLLAIALAAVLWGAGMLATGPYNWVVPFFGMIASGAAGAALVLAALPFLGYIAWGSYRRRVSAWWCALVLALLWCVSSVITFARVPMVTYYEKMGLPSANIEIIRQNPVLQSSAILCGAVLWSVIAIIYLLVVRRFFFTAAAPVTSSPLQP